MDTRHLERTTLHDAVWSRPLGELARDWAVSPSQIAQACTRMRVPLPGSEHWDRARAGLRPGAGPLPTASEVSRSVEIPWKGKAKKDPPTASAAAPPSPETQEHPLVLATRLALEASTTVAQGIVQLPAGRRSLDLRVTREGAAGAVVLLASLLDALNKAGGTVEVLRSTADGAGYESRVVIDGEQIPFGIEEEVRREDPPRPPSSSETREPRGYRPRGRRRKPTWPDSTFHSTGKLTLRIHGLQGTGARQNLVDRPSARLESRLDAIVTMFREAAATVKTRREDVARREREYHDHQRQRAAAERERREHEELVQQMFQMKRHWVAAQELRTFIAAIEAAVPEQTEAMVEWLDWAKGYADAVDPLATPGKAEELLLKYDTRTWYGEAVLGTGKKTTIW